MEMVLTPQYSNAHIRGIGLQAYTAFGIIRLDCDAIVILFGRIDLILEFGYGIDGLLGGSSVWLGMESLNEYHDAGKAANGRNEQEHRKQYLEDVKDDNGN